MNKWTWRKPSETCEHATRIDLGSVTLCGKPSTVAYPAMGGGWCSLCPEHGAKHASFTVPLAEALRPPASPPVTEPA